MHEQGDDKRLAVCVSEIEREKALYLKAVRFIGVEVLAWLEEERNRPQEGKVQENE